ncbi:MAG: polyhydroxyalkanoic acid system family protein [Myxococcales bacterium]|nr:polyhydroxyalkanoic acid system family protein [Myxococcales bacterium]
MEIDFQYVLSDQEARARLDVLGQYLMNKHGIKVTWVDEKRARFSGKYLLVKIEGELSLGSSHAVFKGEDPGFLLRGRAKDYIQSKLAKYLDPKIALADLPKD